LRSHRSHNLLLFARTTNEVTFLALASLAPSPFPFLARYCFRPHDTAVNKVFSPRDFVSAQSWKRFRFDDRDTLCYVSQPVIHPEAPPVEGVVRADG
jgi:hypothetical protein